MVISEFFTNLSSSGTVTSLIILLLFFTTVIVAYAVFVFYFYKFLAKKNIVDLNLNKYNTSEHPAITKFFAFIFYVIEYLIILPIMTFVWFAVFSMFLLVLAKALEPATVLLIAAALIASVRITAYVSEALSRDLAKMIPFTLLALALTTPGFFSVADFISRFNAIPALLYQIPYYLLFIITLELIMRTASLLGRFLTFEKPADDSQ